MDRREFLKALNSTVAIAPLIGLGVFRAYPILIGTDYSMEVSRTTISILENGRWRQVGGVGDLFFNK